MISLNQERVKDLLDSITDLKVKKRVEILLRELQNPTADSSKPIQSSSSTKRRAKRALQIVAWIGIELVKHEIAGDILNLFD